MAHPGRGTRDRFAVHRTHGRARETAAVTDFPSSRPTAGSFPGRAELPLDTIPLPLLATSAIDEHELDELVAALMAGIESLEDVTR